jgi:hypothetical protein
MQLDCYALSRLHSLIVFSENLHTRRILGTPRAAKLEAQMPKKHWTRGETADNTIFKKGESLRSHGLSQIQIPISAGFE